MKYFSTIFIAVLYFLVSTSFAQLPWTKDANNPVMSGGTAGTWNRHVFMPCVLYNPDSSRYEMWFGASYGPPNWRPYRIGFAVSSDGVNWTKHATAVLEPDSGEWDESTLQAPVVLRENGEYKMWYTGWSPTDPAGGIGFATSPNGIEWTKDTLNNPVLKPGTASWEAGGPLNCTVIPAPGGGYKMWYASFNDQTDSVQIGWASSQDGIIWQKDSLNNPVMTGGPVGDWDDAFVIPAEVLFIDGSYHMWYTGMRINTDPRQIGYATSQDGIFWNKYDDPITTSSPYSASDPVLSPSQGHWDGNFIEGGTVMLVEDTLKMWYGGGREPTGTNLWRIGHAVAPYIPVGVDDHKFFDSPEDFVLSQNYPNPFNPTTTIEFSLPQSDFVTLKIYNLLGEEVETLVSEKLSAGKYRYEWNAGIYASGLYYYSLESGNYHETQKMILMK